MLVLSPMRQRDKTAKTRRRKSLTLKRRNASKALRRHDFSPASEEKNVARLSRELSEASEQQAATAEILNVISNSPTDTQPVFDAIVQSGLKLFPGALVSVALRYGDTINAAAVAAPDPARVEAWRRTISRTPLARNYMHGAALLDRRIVDIPDVADAPAEFAAGAQNFLTSGNRAITIMPMMRGNEAIGLLSVVRLVPGPLSDKQIAVLRTFANQAVIAIENTRLLNELRESLQQQTATADVLKVISRSPGELEPVFKAMLENATRICDAKFGNLFRYEGDVFHPGASLNCRPLLRTSWTSKARLRPSPVSSFGRLCQSKAGHPRRRPCRPSQTSVRRSDTAGADRQSAVPMLKDKELVGAFFIYRSEVRPFTDKQIELVKTSPRRPSSPSRTRGCSTSCANPAAADRHRRRAQGHQPLDVRLTGGPRYARRSQRSNCAKLSVVRYFVVRGKPIRASRIATIRPNSRRFTKAILSRQAAGRPSAAQRWKAKRCKLSISLPTRSTRSAKRKNSAEVGLPSQCPCCGRGLQLER